MTARTSSAYATAPADDADFRAGMQVVFVDRATGAPVETATVASILPDSGEVLLEGWTARFALRDGRGLPLVEYEDLPSCAVVDMTGRTLRPAGAPVPVPVRTIKPRYDIRPATDADARAIEEREEAARLATALSRRLSRAARAGTLPTLGDLVRAERFLAPRAAV